MNIPRISNILRLALQRIFWGTTIYSYYDIFMPLHFYML